MWQVSQKKIKSTNTEMLKHGKVKYFETGNFYTFTYYYEFWLNISSYLFSY